jgi:hypothetical protein
VPVIILPIEKLRVMNPKSTIDLKTIFILFLFVLLSLPLSAKEPISWETYENQAWGYRLSYPGRWQIIEAKVAQEKKAAWSGDVLFEGELQKVTFGETDKVMWPGEFQVIVLSNPQRWDLKEWIRNYEIRDVSGGI